MFDLRERRQGLAVRLALLMSAFGLIAGFGLARLRHLVQAPSARSAKAALSGPPLLSGSETRALALEGMWPGEPGTGGYFGAWKRTRDNAETVRHIAFQYADMPHQSETALNGMWLFLASELLFFGGLFLLYMIYRFMHPAGIAEGSRHTELLIGTINTILLATSSATFAYGLGCARQGRNRLLFWACIATMTIGIAFLMLKMFEWKDDLEKNLFPGPHFSIHGPNSGGAQLFWSFYWMSTVLHGMHMVVGIGLIAWIASTARARRYSSSYHTPVEVVGLYWSFVDMVWMVLYPTIYLAGRIGS